jgi:hypothetical protein
MSRPSPARAAAPVLLAVTVLACGVGAPPTPAAPALTSTPAAGASGAPNGSAAPVAIPPACTVLSDTDIAAITGLAVVSKDDDVADTVYANHCRWTIRRADGGAGTLDLGLLSPEGRERYDRTSEQLAFEPFDGLPADAAGGDPDSASIYAVRGDTLVDVYALGLGLSRETTGELARRVLEQLFGLAPTAPSVGPQATTGGGVSVADPCTLLTDADILEVTGAAPISHASSPWFGQWDSNCTWQIEGGGPVPATIKVFVRSPGGRASWDQYLVPIQGEFTAVPGLGDAAFEKVQWPTHVLAGDTYVSVQLAGGSSTDVTLSTELARRVVARLGG